MGHDEKEGGPLPQGPPPEQNHDHHDRAAVVMVPHGGNGRVVAEETDGERQWRQARDRIADQRRRRDVSTLLEDLAPLAVYYSGAYRWPLLYGPEAVGGRRSA